MYDKMMKEINHKSSDYSAETIYEMNNAPNNAFEAIKKAKEQGVKQE